MVAQLARELERDDACDVRLERENLQIEHELRVVGECRRNPYGSIQVGHRVVHCTGLGTLNLPLYLADAFEILINTCSVGNATRRLPRDIGA